MIINLASIEDGQRLAAALESHINRSKRIMDHRGADHLRRIAAAVAVGITREKEELAEADVEDEREAEEAEAEFEQDPYEVHGVLRSDFR